MVSKCGEDGRWVVRLLNEYRLPSRITPPFLDNASLPGYPLPSRITPPSPENASDDVDLFFYRNLWPAMFDTLHFSAMSHPVLGPLDFQDGGILLFLACLLYLLDFAFSIVGPILPGPFVSTFNFRFRFLYRQPVVYSLYRLEKTPRVLLSTPVVHFFY